jgi:hypothetical protein
MMHPPLIQPGGTKVVQEQSDCTPSDDGCSIVSFIKQYVLGTKVAIEEVKWVFIVFRGHPPKNQLLECIKIVEVLLAMCMNGRPRGLLPSSEYPIPVGSGFLIRPDMYL